VVAVAAASGAEVAADAASLARSAAAVVAAAAADLMHCSFDVEIHPLARPAPVVAKTAAAVADLRH